MGLSPVGVGWGRGLTMHAAVWWGPRPRTPLQSFTLRSAPGPVRLDQPGITGCGMPPCLSRERDPSGFLKSRREALRAAV